MIKYILIPFLVFGFLTSCSESELITPGDEFLPAGMKDGSYVVDINGEFWNFSKQTGAQNGIDESSVNGSNQTGGQISISIPHSLAVGTYDQIDGATVTVTLPDGVYVNADLQGALPFVLNITQVISGTSGKVSGNFTGTVYNAATGQTRTLTNGSFKKILFQGTAAGSAILKADFNEQQIDFSTDAKAEGIMTAAKISGLNPDENQTLTITVPNGIAVGTYTEAQEVVIEVNLGTSGNPADNYSNFNPQDGSYLPVILKITGITEGEDGKVTGTFSGTIAKFVNGEPANTVEITNGQIKVPVVNP